MDKLNVITGLATSKSGLKLQANPLQIVGGRAALLTAVVMMSASCVWAPQSNRPTVAQSGTIEMTTSVKPQDFQTAGQDASTSIQELSGQASAQVSGYSEEPVFVEITESGVRRYSATSYEFSTINYATMPLNEQPVASTPAVNLPIANQVIESRTQLAYPAIANTISNSVVSDPRFIGGMQVTSESPYSGLTTVEASYDAALPVEQSVYIQIAPEGMPAQGISANSPPLTTSQHVLDSKLEVADEFKQSLYLPDSSDMTVLMEGDLYVDVESGQTIQDIAEMYTGSAGNWKQLVDLNHLSPDGKIRSGTRVRIPNLLKVLSVNSADEAVGAFPLAESIPILQ